MIQLTHVRPLYPSIHMARVSRALSADRAREQLTAALQHRADHDHLNIRAALVVARNRCCGDNNGTDLTHAANCPLTLGSIQINKVFLAHWGFSVWATGQCYGSLGSDFRFDEIVY